MRALLFFITVLSITPVYAKRVVVMNSINAVVEGTVVKQELPEEGNVGGEIDNSGMMAYDAPPGTAGDVIIPKPGPVGGETSNPKADCLKQLAKFKKLRTEAETSLKVATSRENEAAQKASRCRSSAAYEAMSNTEVYVCSGMMSAAEVRLKFDTAAIECAAKPMSTAAGEKLKKDQPIILTTPDYQSTRQPASLPTAGSFGKAGRAQSAK